MVVYGKIRVSHDLTRRAAPYITFRLADHLQVDLRSLYLDVACETGNYTAALAVRGGAYNTRRLPAPRASYCLNFPE
jgi:hypothetical protein